MTRRTKHNAVKLRAYIGTQDCKFDSKAEYRYALWLEREREAGRIDQWVHHPGPTPLIGQNGLCIALMEPDFAVWRSGDGCDYELHEVKGMATAAWRIKRKVLESMMHRPSYIVIDAGWPDEKNGGPRLFDDRRKNRAAKKKARAAKKKWERK